MSRTIYTGLGANEDVTADISSGTVDISSAVIELAVGTYTAPGAWQTPNNVTFLTNFSAVASLTIGQLFYNPVAGKYWLWYQVSVGGKVIIQPVKSQAFTVTDVAGISVGTTAPFAYALTRTAVKTGNYTSAANELVPWDLTTGSFTQTLPTAPADKTTVAVKIVVTPNTTNTVTIAAGGSDVFNKAGGSTALTLAGLNRGIVLEYTASGAIWTVIADDLPLAFTDGRYVTTVPAPTGVAATDTANVQAALTAAGVAGGRVVIQAGTYVINQTLILKSNVELVGMGMAVSVLKLADATEADLIQTYQFASLTGTTAAGGVSGFAIRNLTLDGNYAGQTTFSSFPLRIFGYAYTLENLKVQNGDQGGIWSEWSEATASSHPTEMEAHWRNVRVKDYQGRPSGHPTYGVYFAGPHDSVFSDVIISSLASGHSWNGTVYGLYVATTALSILASNIHVWGRHHYSVYLASGTCNFTNLYAEGAFTANVVMSTGSTWVGGFILGTNSQNTSTPSNINEVGIQIGDSAASLSCHGASISDVWVQSFTTGGFVLAVSSDGGGNVVELNTNALSPNLLTGTLATSDTVRIIPWNAPTTGVYQSVVPSPGSAIQVFTSSGTWTKPTAATTVTCYMLGGGGGGQGGGRQASGTIAVGGCGGGGGGYTAFSVAAATLGATVGVTVGTGGTGGIANLTDTSAGASGTNGGASSFSTYGAANGGNGGAAGSGGNGGLGQGLAGGAGALALASGLAASNAVATGGGAGGGAGGGITAANAVAAGSKGAAGAIQNAGGNGGAAGVIGSNGAASPAQAAGGGGGGGGSGTGGGFVGGNGGNYGAGGGGGGASQNSAASGAGGNGAGGVVIVVCT